MNRGERMKWLRNVSKRVENPDEVLLSPPLPPGCRTEADVYRTNEMPMVRVEHVPEDYDPDSYTTPEGRVGTRIIPLDELAAHHPLAAMRRVVDARRHGLRAAIGVNYLMESDELDDYNTSVYAYAF